MPLRLAGLAAAAGFATALYLTGNFVFEPLTALRKLALVGIGAGLLGWVADLAFKPARMAGIMLGLLAGAASTWVFSTVLMQGRPWRRSDTAWESACWCSSRSPSCSTCIPIRFVPAQPGSGWASAPASARSSAPRR